MPVLPLIFLLHLSCGNITLSFFLKTVNNFHDLESKLYFQLNYKPMGKILMSGHISDQSSGDFMIIWGLESFNALTLTIYTLSC